MSRLFLILLVFFFCTGKLFPQVDQKLSDHEDTTARHSESGRWSFSHHAGASIPIGKFSNDYKTGVCFILDVDYQFSKQYYLVGLFEFNKFNTARAGLEDEHWMNISVNLRFKTPTKSSWSGYFGLGPGYYFLKNGESKFGGNLGPGINLQLNPRLIIELGANFHILFGSNVKFMQSHLGIIFNF